MPDRTRDAVGCLLIDDPLAGEGTLPGLSSFVDTADLHAQPFRWSGTSELYGALQFALHALRQACAEATVAARGLGCGAALALAAQLPVERMALIEPRLALPRRLERSVPASLRRQVRRLCGFARRNLSLCVCDALIIEAPRGSEAFALTRAGLGAHGRVARLETAGIREKVLCTNGEFNVKEAVSVFLRRGELPKSLAENAEMCIIYG